MSLRHDVATYYTSLSLISLKFMFIYKSENHCKLDPISHLKQCNNVGNINFKNNFTTFPGTDKSKYYPDEIILELAIASVKSCPI